MINRTLISLMKRFTLKLVLANLILFCALSDLRAGADVLEMQQVSVDDSAKVKQDSTTTQYHSPISTIAVRDSTVLTPWDSPWKITESMKNQYLYEDMGDILNLLPGVYLIDLGSAGQKLSITRHGATASQVSVFIDGRPFYNPIHGGVDLNLLPVEFIRQIRVEQGLSAVMLLREGESVSVESEQYDDTIPYSQIYHHKAALGFSDVDFVFGQKVSRKMNILIGGAIKSFDGENEYSLYSHQNFRSKFEYTFSPRWRAEYVVMSNKIDRDTPGPLLESGIYSTRNAKYKDSRVDHTLNIYGRILKSAERNFRANFFYSSLYSKLTDNEFDLIYKNRSQYTGGNFRLMKQLWGQRLSVGGDFVHEQTDADEVGKQEQSWGSIFIQDDWQWRNKFGVKLLANYQLHELYGSDFVYALGSYFNIAKNIKLMVSARQTIRYPNLYELYARTNFIGNLELDYELHQKLIAGLESQFFSRWDFKAYFFQKNISRLIRCVETDSSGATFQNIGDVAFYGFDFQTGLKLAKKFNMSVAFSTIDNTNLYDQPNVQLTGIIQYKDNYFEDYLKTIFRLEARFIGERNSLVRAPYQFSGEYVTLSPVWVLSTSAVLNFGRLTFFLRMENILDEQYQLVYGFPMQGRTFHYGLRWEFWD